MGDIVARLFHVMISAANLAHRKANRSRRIISSGSSKAAQVRKNANQTLPRINTARPVLIVNSNSTDGPGSAWRASVGVSMIMPCFLIGMKLSVNFSAARTFLKIKLPNH
jgi:hypothetical protein